MEKVSKKNPHGEEMGKLEIIDLCMGANLLDHRPCMQVNDVLDAEFLYMRHSSSSVLVVFRA